MTPHFLKNTKEKIFFSYKNVSKSIILLIFETRTIFFGKSKLLQKRNSNLEYSCKIWNINNRESLLLDYKDRQKNLQ